jgi:hypothetical protein
MLEHQDQNRVPGFLDYLFVMLTFLVLLIATVSRPLRKRSMAAVQPIKLAGAVERHHLLLRLGDNLKNAK